MGLTLEQKEILRELADVSRPANGFKMLESKP